MMRERNYSGAAWQLVDRKWRAPNVPVVSVSDVIAETDNNGVVVTLYDFSYQTSMPPGLTSSLIRTKSPS